MGAGGGGAFSKRKGGVFMKFYQVNRVLKYIIGCLKRQGGVIPLGEDEKKNI